MLLQLFFIATRTGDAVCLDTTSIHLNVSNESVTFGLVFSFNGTSNLNRLSS